MKRFGPIITAAALSLVAIPFVIGGTPDPTAGPTGAGPNGAGPNGVGPLGASPPGASPAGTTLPAAGSTTKPASKAEKPKIKKGMTVEEAQTTADELDPAHAPHTAVQDTKIKSTTTEFWVLDVYDESQKDAELDRHYRLAVIKGVVDHMNVNTTRTLRSALATTGPTDGTDPAATGIGGGTAGTTDSTGTTPGTNTGTDTSNTQNGNTGTSASTTNNNTNNTGTGSQPGNPPANTGGGRGGGGRRR